MCAYDKITVECPGTVLCAEHCVSNGGVDNGGAVCCKALLADCMACQNSQTTAEYCATRPATGELILFTITYTLCEPFSQFDSLPLTY